MRLLAATTLLASLFHVMGGHSVSGWSAAASPEVVAPGPRLLPQGRAVMPAYARLADGPLRVRLLKGSRTPTLGHYAVASGESVSNLIAYVDRTGLGGSWMVMGGGPGAQHPYVATRRPVFVSQFVAPLHEKRLDDDPRHSEDVRRTVSGAQAFVSFLMAEWENMVWAWWSEVDPEPILGKSDAELRKMDRRSHYETVLDALRTWKRRAGGRLSLMTGHGLHSHVAEIGLDALGIETSETIAATQVKRAYCRGAARQFGIPWTESVSVWFGPSVTSPGRPARQIDTWPGVTVGGDAGHSLSHFERLWYTSWFAGAADINQETSTQLLFEDQWDTSRFAAEPKLSRFGEAADRFCRHMREVDVGVPYTPFGVIVRKDHGRWTNWGDPWGRFPQTLGDKLTARFFDQIFPGQSRGPGDEERYLCPSPYGDTFDVLVADADRSSWKAYPVLIALGEVPWTSDDIRALTEHTRAGGVLVLHEVNLAGWDRALIGLDPHAMRPARGASAVMLNSDGSPALIRRRLGKGWVFVVPTGPDSASARALPDALLREFARRYLPCEVEGNVQTLINRTREGWLLLLVNNEGIRKKFTERETIDPSRTVDVRVEFSGTRLRAEELLRGDAAGMVVGHASRTTELRVSIPPGEMRLIRMSSTAGGPRGEARSDHGKAGN